MSCPRSLSNVIKDLTIPPNDLFTQSTIKFAHAQCVYVCMFICKCRDDNDAHAYLYPYPQSPESVRQIKNRVPDKFRHLETILW